MNQILNRRILATTHSQNISLGFSRTVSILYYFLLSCIHYSVILPLGLVLHTNLFVATANPVVNMAEAFAVVGLASALLQFLDFGTKVIRRLRQFENLATEGASCFKSVRNRFPLVLDLVKKIMLQMDAGLISDNSKEVMYPVVQNCISQAQAIDKLMNRSLPQQNDSSWVRGRKAVYGVWPESEVERIEAGLRSNFELLMEAGTFQTSDRSMDSNSISFAPTFTVSPTVQVTLAQQANQPAQPQPWEEAENQTHITQSIFMVPFARDANFLGRQDVIDLVSEKFSEKPFFDTLA